MKKHSLLVNRNLPLLVMWSILCLCHSHAASADDRASDSSPGKPHSVFYPYATQESISAQDTSDVESDGKQNTSDAENNQAAMNESVDDQQASENVADANSLEPQDGTVDLSKIIIDDSQVHERTNGRGSLLDVSLEQLIEEPVIIIVSATRVPQEKSDSSVPITVISKDDIHYSGLTNIAEILQFAPGVDYLKINRYYYAVGVHGFHEGISDRIQVLINGRKADSPIFGGPEFYLIPLQTEDIERIEIVRSPAAAVWGANAFTGMINIITKRPKDVQGLFESTAITNFGDVYNHLRYGSLYKDWYWKFSLGYDDVKSSREAGGEDIKYHSFYPALNAIVDVDKFDVQDNSRVWKLDFEAENEADKFMKMNFGVGHTDFQGGDNAQFGYQSGQKQRCELTRIFAKTDYDFQDGSTGSFQWFSNISSIDRPDTAHYDTIENAIDFMINNELQEDHTFSWGGNFTWLHATTGARADGVEIFTDRRFDEYMAGLFLLDTYKPSDKFKIETQIRGDWYSETQADVSARLSGLYYLDESKNEIIRLSAARAIRSPLSSLQRIAFIGKTVDGNIIPIIPILPKNLENEQTYSFELGYQKDLSENIHFNSNLYYQIFEELIGYAYIPAGGGVTNVQAQNMGGADTWGADIELAYKTEKSKLSLWYSYNDYQQRASDLSVRAYLPVQHKAGLGYRYFMDHDWVFNMNYRYQDTTYSDPGAIPVTTFSAYNRMDLNLSKKFSNGNGEMMIGVNDLFNKTSDSLCEISNFVGYDVPGRTFFLRFQWYF